MAEEFGGDLTAAVFWGADLRGARSRDVNLTDVTISHAWLVDVEIDAFIDRVVVNGVRRDGVRQRARSLVPVAGGVGRLRPEKMRAGVGRVARKAWAASIARARRLPDEDLHVSVNGEWSFVQTLRHRLFAMDKWFTAPVLSRRFHPIGLPNSACPDFDQEAAPSLSEVLAARADQATRLGGYLAAMTADDLTRTVEVLEGDPHLVRDCISTCWRKSSWHHRYAERDLAELETR